MSTLSTHILDTARGAPAPGVEVTLAVLSPDEQWQTLGAARTDNDGRIRAFPGVAAPLPPATYRLRFNTAAYHTAQGLQPFFPHVDVVFKLSTAQPHHHIPLLLSPFAYSTYRGS